MKKIYLKIKKLEFTIQAKGVFLSTFLFSITLFLTMSATLNFSIGFTVFQICCFYIFLVGLLNLFIGLFELYEALVNNDNYKIHLDSFLLIFSNFLIGILYAILIYLIDNKFSKP
ncbi:hypothetical protein [Cloacibacterium sp.]|uniref:hypothetical protein n=1 Tax=Cloacibacterium sp. TaxID=1913682 RepID=UPI0039E345DF